MIHPQKLRVVQVVCVVFLVATSAGCAAPGANLFPADDDARSRLPAWAAQSYPAGYERWERIKEDPIPHPDENEMVVLYMNSVGAQTRARGYSLGTVLVKAQHRIVDGRKGPVYQLSVMRKKGGTKQAGWTFSVYDPVRYMQRKFDQDVCLVCHQQRASNDFIFTGP